MTYLTNLPTKKVNGESDFLFMPEIWTRALTGIPHKASYRRGHVGMQLMKCYTITKGYLLLFDSGVEESKGFVYADHVWRICKYLYGNILATLTICPDGIRIHQPGPLSSTAFLKWQKKPDPLGISGVVR